MRTLKIRFFALLCVMLMGTWGLAWAQPAGEIEYARGAGFAKAPGQIPRALGKGLALHQGDVLSTAENSTVIVKLNDGTRMTMRPNSELVLQQYRFKEHAPDNSMIMQLLKGGLRAITGLISKDAPDAAKIRTTTVTIGIRGTDFDARLCGPECQAESNQIKSKPRENVVAASARLTAAIGAVYATDAQSVRRRLVEGGSVYPGDVVETDDSGQGILVFRDDSRFTLGRSTRIRVDSFDFDAKSPAQGKFLTSLLQGSMRALTGLIGKADPHNVRFNTLTAVIGIRGTGLDLDCAAVGACRFFTWLGSIAVTPQGQTTARILPVGSGLYVGPDGIKPLTESTLDALPRPDNVPVDLHQLFSVATVASEGEGLFVYVRDGHIEITTPTQTLHLGRGETGYAASDGRAGRPENTPAFIQFDRVPLPNVSHPQLIELLHNLELNNIDVCP